MNYNRFLDISQSLRRKSLFLFGPRQTGKTTFLQQSFPKARFLNLLEADTFREYSAHPELLRQRLKEHEKLVIIDEVQKLPALLDEVQALVDRNKSLRFILTGSSARKLKRGQANLLAGRALVHFMHPLVYPELEGNPRILDRIQRGALPAIIDTPSYRQDLSVYVGTYLKEEIQAEGLSRSIENFSRFLEVAGLCNAETINFTQVGSDCGIPPRTIHDHFLILQDTLVGRLVNCFQKSKKRKPVAASKFYFFDPGVVNSLTRRFDIVPGTPEFGKSFEHLIFLELQAYLDYHLSEHELCYWRSQSKMEVDFVFLDKIGIEVKAKKFVPDRDLTGLRALGEENLLKRRIVVTLEKEFRKTEDNIEIFPVAEFLEHLWAGRLEMSGN